MPNLEMRPVCECCAADLPADAPGAVICSHECTFCSSCAEDHLDRACPNCGGSLMPRPTRVGPDLAENPAATERIVSDGDCPGTGAAGRHGGAPTSGGVRRHPERREADRAGLDALLDEVLVGTLSTVIDGRPWVVPMLFARDGDRILLHGSTGAGALRQVAAGAPACLSVVSLDGIVVAHSTFDSSANYRSAVVYGALTTLEDEDRERSLDVLSERLIPGRTGEVRPMTRKELAATLAVALPIEDGSWFVKARTGGVGDTDEATDAWTGVIPLRIVADEPIPSTEADRDSREVPASVRDFVAARR